MKIDFSLVDPTVDCTDTILYSNPRDYPAFHLDHKWGVPLLIILTLVYWPTLFMIWKW